MKGFWRLKREGKEEQDEDERESAFGSETVMLSHHRYYVRSHNPLWIDLWLLECGHLDVLG
jgi:hypothetical protein